MSQIWQVRLSDQAELDLIAISHWTAENFGPHQAEQYVETLFWPLTPWVMVPGLLRLRSEASWALVFIPCTLLGRAVKADILSSIA